MHAEMIKPRHRSTIALVAAMLVGVTVALSGPAEAASATDRSVVMSARQWQLVDQMTHTALFAALGINTVRGVHAIERERERFALTLRALRDGNGGLGLEPARAPEVLRQIDRVETLWQSYDSAMLAVIHDLRWKPLVEDAHMEALFDLHDQITAAIDDTTEAFRRSRQRLTTAQR